MFITSDDLYQRIIETIDRNHENEFNPMLEENYFKPLLIDIPESDNNIDDSTLRVCWEKRLSVLSEHLPNTFSDEIRKIVNFAHHIGQRFSGLREVEMHASYCPKCRLHYRE